MKLMILMMWLLFFFSFLSFLGVKRMNWLFLIL